LKLPACWNCKKQFSYGKLLLLWGGSTVCPRCGETNYLTAESRKKGAWYTPILIILMVIGLNMFDIGFPGIILYGLIFLLIGLSLSPFTFHFTDEQEPLF
jgi:CXXC-20-CXXC protein